jgi:hypothetical protein
LTDSLKLPGFNPRTYQVRNWFQNLLTKCNLYRYTAVGEARAVAARAGDAATRQRDALDAVTAMLSEAGLALFTTLFCSQNTFN